LGHVLRLEVGFSGLFVWACGKAARREAPFELTSFNAVSLEFGAPVVLCGPLLLGQELHCAAAED